MANVVLENVRKVYPGGFEAVKKANLTIHDKEFVVLVGPSGCGKSTTLRMIAGLEEITGGTISIDGRVVNDVPPKDRDIAMVFQNYALYPHMSVYQNMAFGLKLRGVPRKEIDERVRDAAKILGIEMLLERKPKALSGGQRQRVAVGRAIVRQPKAFLFDEPLSNLDAKMRVQMRMEINKLHHQLASTMIYVTHDQVEAMTMGDRIVVMKDGVIQQEASPMEIYDHPVNRFVAGFIGSTPMNFFEGWVEALDEHLVFTEGNFKAQIAPEHAKLIRESGKRKIVFGIRPERIEDSVFSTHPDPHTLVRAKVEVVEPMGAEVYLYLAVGEHNFVARVDGHEKASVNEELTLVFDMEHASYFDMDSGDRIA